RVVLLSDEIHCDFVTRGNKYIPFASLPNKAIVNNSITFKAASKSFSLAAMKVAWFFSTNADYLERVKANNGGDRTTVGLIANDAAISEGADWLDQCVSYIDGNHEFVESYIKTNVPMIKCVKPQGTYLSWLDVSAVMDKVGAKQQAAAQSAKDNKTVTPEQYMERWFVEHAGVHLNAGSTYGTGGAGHMRMNIATARKTLEDAGKGLQKGTKNPGSLRGLGSQIQPPIPSPSQRPAPSPQPPGQQMDRLLLLVPGTLVICLAAGCVRSTSIRPRLADALRLEASIRAADLPANRV